MGGVFKLLACRNSQPPIRGESNLPALCKPISAGRMAAAATILLYPPGEAPDYTKRPNPQAERVPLFPLDPFACLPVLLECIASGAAVAACVKRLNGPHPIHRGAWTLDVSKVTISGLRLEAWKPKPEA